MRKIGIAITDFTIESFSYPEEIKKMQEKVAAQSMIGDMNKYTQVSAADAMQNGRAGGGMAADMVNLQMGMAIGQQMINQMNQNGAVQNLQGNMPQNNVANPQQTAGGSASGPKFCPNCGTPTTGMKFCANCGNQLF